jgi:hypothetical protein
MKNICKLTMSSTIDLLYLLEKSKGVSMTAVELEEQRRSFAYGNTTIENERITRRMIDEQADELKKAE